mmetsp:Transcript_3946/g.9607  ORF Transcript_3946/g.9607 Transcript_3946/m.9607 type:complete len:927 (-) Transcript_3946:356-3136(-)
MKESELRNPGGTETATDRGGCISVKCSDNCSLSRKNVLRVILVVSLLAAGVVCASVAFVLLEDTETQMGVNTYESIATLAISGARSITRRKFRGVELMASIMAETWPDAEDWPFISYPGYRSVARKVSLLVTNDNPDSTQSLMVIVDPSEVAAWENHTREEYIRQNRTDGVAGVSDFGFGIYQVNASLSEYDDRRYHDTTGETFWGGDRGILSPLMMHNVKDPRSLLFNLYSRENRGVHIDAMYECAEEYHSQDGLSLEEGEELPTCAVVTDMLELQIKPGPAGLMFHPIFPANNQSQFVGFATSSIHWEEVLDSVVPDYVDGLICIISTETSKATYEINGGVPFLKGDGDLHDPKYDSFARSTVLNDVFTGSKTSVTYTLTVYPTDAVINNFSTGTPLAVAIGFFSVILLCAILFLGYDLLVRQESHQRQMILDVKRRFVRFISHEIRTPMNTVCIGLELLLSEMKNKMNRKDSFTEDQSENLEDNDIDFWRQVTVDVNENAHIAVSILNDLLDYDKLETGTLVLEIEPVPIWNVVGRAVGQFQITAINKSIELSLKDVTKPSKEKAPIDADIEKGTTTRTDTSSNDTESSTSSYITLGDHVKIGQVLRNVISNALKFTPPGGSIEVQTCHLPDGLPHAKPVLLENGKACDRPRAGSIQISIKDSGVGLTSDQVEQLFSEGIQFNANKLQHGGGSGLGLNIAKGFVEQQSGKISAASDGPGCGTCFMIELPLYEFPVDEVEQILDDMASTVSPQTVGTSSVTTSGHRNLNGNSSTTKNVTKKKKNTCRRILVAEDVDSSRKMLIRLLERAGHDCVPARNGKDAVDIIEKDMQDAANDPDHAVIEVVLMDFEMPILNGPEATNAIREMGYSGVVVGVTGNVLEEDIEYFQSNGADRVLPKPVNLKSLQGCWNGEAERSDRSRALYK